MLPTFEYQPRFISKLVFEDDGGFPFTLLNPLGYVSNVNHRGTFFIPAGFKTDLASIPKALWNILPPVGKYDAAAVVHDFFYREPKLLMKAGKIPMRAEADAVLNEAMEVCGVDRAQRLAIYAGVRLGGWVTWQKYRQQEKVSAV